MSKVTVASESFVAGAIFGFFVLSLIYASTPVQASQGRAVEISGVEPVVPPIRATFEGSILNGEVQGLDGLACLECTITASKLTYGGGAYNLTNPHFPSSVTVELHGAALNTFNLLRAVGAIPTPRSTPQNPKPLTQLAEIIIKPSTASRNLVSLEGLKK